ncbi:restriction endonuclease subunit S [Clostridium sp. YIM B02515]|uniref:Restriction endonuclease subunit S n=1 Tax=Clostridium rhizosphaerae TaxID=2803861 RepID=A0ABS1TEJ4_9CLOT|nr:restriction endonuclease subunit S [Clostridium rhizosphaerae]MBL4937787.1 restriction endonuclease subunit S [Clostridium rhizosphaerae]
MVIGWMTEEIRNIADIYSGGTPSTCNPSYWNGDIIWCTPSDITNQKSKYLKTTERCITKEGLANSGATLLPKGTLLLCTRATIGEVVIATTRVATNQGFKNLVCRDSFDNEFIYYAIKPLKDEMIKKAHGSTFLEISKKSLEDIKINIPIDKSEQTAVAKALSDIDDLITSLEKLIGKKKVIKQGTMQELLTGKKRLPGFEGEWNKSTLEQLCYLITKQTGFDYSAEIKPSLVTTNQNGTIPFIQNKDFESFSINYDTDFYIPYSIAIKYSKILLDEVCLLISISGRIGNVAVFDNEYTAFAGGAVGIAKLKDASMAEWCMLYLLSDDGQKQIFSHEKVGAQHNLTVEDVRTLEIMIPEEKERKSIIEILLDMESEIEQLQEKLVKYRKIRQGMMSELLTGKIRLI